MGMMDESDQNLSSSSDEEREDEKRLGGRRIIFETPLKSPFNTRAVSTPATVPEMTPSPAQGSISDSVSSDPGRDTSRSFEKQTSTLDGFFQSEQRVFRGNLSEPTNLFPDISHSQRRGKRRSLPVHRSRLSESLLLEGYCTPIVNRGIEKRRSVSSQKLKSLGSRTGSPERRPSTAEFSSKGSPERGARNQSWIKLDILPQLVAKYRWRTVVLLWCSLVLSLTCSLEMILLTRSAAQVEHFHELSRPDSLLSAAGLRGQMTSGHWKEKKRRVLKVKTPVAKEGSKPKERPTDKVPSKHIEHGKTAEVKPKPEQAVVDGTLGVQMPKAVKGNPSPTLAFHVPPPTTLPKKAKFDLQDRKMYSTHCSKKRRVVSLDPFFQSMSGGPPRPIKLYPADFTDNTQLYSILDSSDERLGHMELRESYTVGECVPMQDWQTTFHPSCNGMHELAMETLGEDNGNDLQLFGTKGFWRYAWRLDLQNVHDQDTMVLKTLKFNHNFEDAHFEHDRVDAVAMERLTSSPHVINAFGFCGHSVLTEFADGKRVGELADKAKKTPLKLLRIASDIAHGLADVHSIDGEGNATFVHLDVNLANVVSINGTLKFNDFNIGIIRQWNTTSNTPCGFPARYPNPQWRSPEEARNENNLTEKVDVFSLGHIFFRLICGHEPWNKLEPGGRPTKEEVSIKVQTGVLPFIPDFVRITDDPEIIAIRDAMLSCYTFDPTERPSARDIANALDKALEALAESDYAQTMEEEVYIPLTHGLAT